ncbi:netrin-1-like [Ischnura elegans]|uniref:netrin-1-like n=1 Tax=Ischnura elegans TaxID=197161 RepID=UPI001ED886C6|nr:netrin-1-like [Ischnura elegans]
MSGKSCRRCISGSASIAVLALIVCAISAQLTTVRAGNGGGGGGGASNGGGGSFLQMFAAQQNPPDACYESSPSLIPANGPIASPLTTSDEDEDDEDEDDEDEDDEDDIIDDDDDDEDDEEDDELGARLRGSSIFQYGSSAPAKPAPRRCVPDFVNAAFGRPVESTSTCGNPPVRLCDVPPPPTPEAPTAPSSSSGPITTQPPAPQPSSPLRSLNLRGPPGCVVCDASHPRRRHPPSYLTDLNNPSNLTCWRSAPLSTHNHHPHHISANTNNGLHITRRPANVTLRLPLGKKFEVTYVSVQFCPGSPRPDALALYKSMDHGRTWQALQFYATDCRRAFGRAPRAAITRANEQEALCTELGASSPAAPARIAFSTLEGRPSAADLDSSPVLQDWVTATDIQVVLVAPQAPIVTPTVTVANGNQTLPIFQQPQSYQPPGAVHFAIADLAVGGRCKCNGHASRCTVVEGPGGGSLACECRHNTAGRDCERCRPFHFDRPWGRATARDPHECRAGHLLPIHSTRTRAIGSRRRRRQQKTFTTEGIAVKTTPTKRWVKAAGLAQGCRDFPALWREMVVIEGEVLGCKECRGAGQWEEGFSARGEGVF